MNETRSIDGLSRRLIHGAARHAPDSLSERLEEEWLADLASRPTGLSRLRFAIGCCWATRVIAYEARLALAPAASSVTGAKVLAAFGHFNWGNLSRRSSTLLLILSLHIALFYVVMTSISHTRGIPIRSPLQNSPIDNPRPKDLPPVLTNPDFSKPRFDIPKPLVDIPAEPDPNDGVIAKVADDAPPVTSPPLAQSAPHAVSKVQGGPGAGFPNVDDYYPPSAIRAEEYGTVIVQVCVDPKGRLTSEPVTLQGSGSSRLDEGALKLAKAGSGHYRASTEDGRPVDSCYAFRVRFQLRH
jgi:protein TonB